MTVELSILIAMVSCFLGLAGWLSGRDKKITADAKWQGSIDAKLDIIVGISKDIENLEVEQKKQGKKLVELESTALYTQKRLDDHIMESTGRL